MQKRSSSIGSVAVCSLKDDGYDTKYSGLAPFGSAQKIWQYSRLKSLFLIPFRSSLISGTLTYGPYWFV